MRLGIHTFTSGSLETAALTAADLGANTFQIFSASPRMWRAGVPDPRQIKLLRAARERFDLNPFVIHVNYLVNLASLDPVIRAKSIDAFRGELHPRHRHRRRLSGRPPRQLPRPHRRGRASPPSPSVSATPPHGLPSHTLTVLLENTAGAGCHLGGKFEELQAIRDLAARAHRPADRLLPGHLPPARRRLRYRDRPRPPRHHSKPPSEILDLANVHVFHANDSKFPVGSHVDRHAHIGEGHIGADAFRRILTHPKLRKKPFILETPIDEPGDDRRNLDTLKSLATRV